MTASVTASRTARWEKPAMVRTEFAVRLDCACACSVLVGAGSGSGGGGGGHYPGPMPQ